MKISLALVAVLVGCGASGSSSYGYGQSTTPQSETPPTSNVSVVEYCKETGNAVCDRVEACGQTFADFTREQCFSAFMQGCCVPRSDGNNLCTNATLTDKTVDEMNTCASGFSTMSCTDLNAWLDDPETVPSFCQ